MIFNLYESIEKTKRRRGRERKRKIDWTQLNWDWLKSDFTENGEMPIKMHIKFHIGEQVE